MNTDVSEEKQMLSELGKNLKISVFGESHAPEIGVIIDGFPKDRYIDENELQKFMDRRRPGKDKFSTPRAEADKPIFESGVGENGMTDGKTIRAVIKNTNVHSGDYDNLKYCPRPGHADYPAKVKYGDTVNMSGGGPFSGRLTAPICIAGGMCFPLLKEAGIKVGAHIFSIGEICEENFAAALPPQLPDAVQFLDEIDGKDFPVIDDTVGEKMKANIKACAAGSDSVGGVVECTVVGVPAGLGGPLFDGVEGKLSAALFGIPAVKAVEFGDGINASKIRGSENNDPFCYDDGKVITKTNHHGGILGGITTGMPLTFKVFFKPTPSIGKPQQTVNLLTNENTEIEIKGRHDPCVVVRAVPVVEAVTAIVMTDLLIENGFKF